MCMCLCVCMLIITLAATSTVLLIGSIIFPMAHTPQANKHSKITLPMSSLSSLTLVYSRDAPKCR